MKSVKQTNLYSQVLKELNYPFADIYILNDIVVSEIKPGVVFTWENHAKVILKDVSDYLGSDISNHIYISNRIHEYSVMATDWLKFFKNNYSLKGYYVVGLQKASVINTTFENLFFGYKIRKFASIEDAVHAAMVTQLELTSF